MVDDPKGYTQIVNDKDWAILSADEPKPDRVSQLKEKASASPDKKPIKATDLYFQNVKPIISTKKRPKEEVKEETESESS